MKALLDGLALARPRIRIRIAGTNGKGSTAHMLAAGLRAAGLRVGLYTSPHILRFNERIRINNVPVEDERLMQALTTLLPRAREIGASWFELATALALTMFTESGVDAEVLEAGVGARLDATTVVSADAALITPIGLDHQAWLGETLEAIAAEKAHAMDGCRIAFSAPQPPEVRAVLKRYRPDLEVIDAPWDGALAMAGAHQRVNAGLAWAALRRLRAEGWLEADETALRRGIEQARAPGRLQRVDWGGRRIWLDAAHNPHAVEALLPSLESLADPFDAVFVYTREDRDLRPALPALRPHARRLIAAAGDADATWPRLEQALTAELAPRKAGNFLVLGSFTTVAATLRWLASKGATVSSFDLEC